jgi:hypothetical protein
MRKLTLMVFNDFVQGATAVYTPSEHNEALGTYDRLAFQVVVDSVNATGNITVQIEHSGDGRNWLNKNGTAEINATAINAGATNNLSGYDSGAAPLLGLVRLRVQLGGAATQANVKVHAVARDNA